MMIGEKMRFKKLFCSLILVLVALVGFFLVWALCGCQTKIGEVEWIENPKEIKEGNRVDL